MPTPIDDRVIIKPDEPEKTSPGGIVLPESAREKKINRGKILAVGPGKLLENGTRQPPDLKKGDRVLYDGWAGSEIELDDAKVRILHAGDVLAVLD